MSCLGPGYNPIPPREWSRFENPCAYSNIDVPQNAAAAYQIAVLKKGNVLQYKNNSANITKRQRYAQIAKGAWVNRTTTWASQTQTYTNPNTNSLKRANYVNLDTNTLLPTQLPLTCSAPVTPSNLSLPAIITNNNSSSIVLPIYSVSYTHPIIETNLTSTVSHDINLGLSLGDSPIIPPVVPPSAGSDAAPLLPPLYPVLQPPPIVIPDGGSLICNISQNICTGEIYSETANQFCYPTSDSDVPGPIIYLCYNDSLPTYYPRVRRVYSAGGNKWPQGEKLIFSGNSVIPTNNFANQIVNQN